MSEPYEEHLFQCISCGEHFIKEEMVEDDGELFCKPCFKDLLKLEGGNDEG